MAGHKGWVTIRNIESVTGIHYNTIQHYIHYTDKFPGVVKNGPDESKGRLIIPVAAVQYFLDNFEVISPIPQPVSPPPVPQPRPAPVVKPKPKAKAKVPVAILEKMIQRSLFDE